jgi:murein DD-endopeptidase MepM/ murein hydrolase activator NlpD
MGIKDKCISWLAVVIFLLLADSSFGQIPFSMPLNQLKLNCGYGYRIHPVTGQLDFHKGVDLAARNEPVYAVLDGIVSFSGSHAILGNYIKIDHGGISTIYGHLSLQFAFSGDTVRANQCIAITGATGRVTGEHLHFAVASGGKPINALAFLAGLAALLTNTK